MKPKSVRLLLIPLLLACGMSGCGEKTQPVVKKREAAAGEPDAKAAETKMGNKPDARPKKSQAAAIAPSDTQKSKTTQTEPKMVTGRPSGKSAATEKPTSVLHESVAAQRESSQRLRLPVSVVNTIGMKLTLIPAGEFMMGSADSGDDVPLWETPQHRVRISKPFYLGVCEVTQAEYESVMGENPSYFEGPGNPVEQVSWNDAVEFCKRLSAKEGKTYRLPTEAEWEYACRAGTTTRYSFGDDVASLERYAWCACDKTYPVGMKRPNAWGLRDMHGNVWECCQDRWAEDYFAVSPTDDPSGPDTGSLRVIRGGGWKDAAKGCRAANRSGFVPAGRLHHLGFRVAADPSDMAEEETLRPVVERVRQPPERR